MNRPVEQRSQTDHHLDDDPDWGEEKFHWEDLGQLALDLLVYAPLYTAAIFMMGIGGLGFLVVLLPGNDPSWQWFVSCGVLVVGGVAIFYVIDFVVMTDLDSDERFWNGLIVLALYAFTIYQFL